MKSTVANTDKSVLNPTERYVRQWNSSFNHNNKPAPGVGGGGVIMDGAHK